MGQELLRGRIEQRAPWPFPPSRRSDPPRVHQYVECALGDLDPADRLDFGAADWLVISDDRQGLGCSARQPPRLLARAAQQMCKIRRSLEMPTAAALHQLDAPAL